MLNFDRYWCSARDAEAAASRHSNETELSEAEAATLARYLEGHPELAANAEAMQELMRRVRHYHRNHPEQAAAERRPRQRQRAHTITNTTTLDPPNTEPRLFILRPNFNEDEDAEEEELNLEEQAVDVTVTIADTSSMQPEELLHMEEMR